MVSRLNAENVVKPPQKPITINNRIFSDIPFVTRSAATRPAIKQPIVFAPKVPHGIDTTSEGFNHRDKRYLSNPPNALPKKTNNNCNTLFTLRSSL